MYSVSEQEGVTRRNVQEALAEVADLESTIDEIVESEVFSQIEEDSGDDEGNRRSIQGNP